MGTRCVNPQFGDMSNIMQQVNALRADVVAIRAEVINNVADVLAVQSGDALLSLPVLAIGTSSAAEVKNSAFDIRVNGQVETVAAGETGFTATTDDIADPDASGREIVYVLSVAQGGTITITPGTIAALAAGVAPSTPAGEVKMGEVLVAHDGSAIFNATTDNLSASHITDTYTDSSIEALAGSNPAAITSADLTAT